MVFYLNTTVFLHFEGAPHDEKANLSPGNPDVSSGKKGSVL
jgi:hypothetical protein